MVPGAHQITPESVKNTDTSPVEAESGFLCCGRKPRTGRGFIDTDFVQAFLSLANTNTNRPMPSRVRAPGSEISISSPTQRKSSIKT